MSIWLSEYSELSVSMPPFAQLEFAWFCAFLTFNPLIQCKLLDKFNVLVNVRGALRSAGSFVSIRYSKRFAENEISFL